MGQGIHYSEQGNVATIRLDRPDVLNASTWKPRVNFVTRSSSRSATPQFTA